ncbi:MAG: sensor histidine kinase [Acidimicrobiales bacterium]
MERAGERSGGTGRRDAVVRRVSRRGAPVRTTLRAGFVGFLVVAVVLGLTAVITVRVTSETIADLTDRIDPLIDLNADLLQALTDAESGERGFLVTGDETFLVPFDEGLETAEGLRGELTSLAAGDTELERLLDQQNDVVQEWIDEFALPIVETARSDREAAARRAATGEGRARFNRVRAANDHVADHLEGRRLDGLDRVDQVAATATTLAVALTGVAGLAALVLTLYARREIVAPLAHLDRALTEMGAGNTAVSVDPSGAREIQNLAAAVTDLGTATRQLDAVRNRRTDHLVRSADLARQVRSELDAAQVIFVAARGIGEALDADVVVISLDIEPGVGVAWSPRGITLDPPPLPPSTRRALDAAIAEAGVVIVDDIANDPRTADPETRAHAAAFDIGSVLVGAVATGSATIGTVLVGSQHRRSWDPFESELLVSTARELGVAVEHAALFERERQMVSELQALDTARSEFVSSVSHELRTPLASIMGYAEMLRDGDAGEVNDAQDAMLDAVDRNAARLLGLIEDLLIVARIEAGRFVLDLEEIDLATVLLSAFATVEATARNRDLALTHRIDPSIPPMQGDARHLERVVLNLLSNAVKFTPDGGNVTLTADSDGTTVRIEVTDSGLGIPADELAEVFDRFFRSSISRTRAVQGTGLGLSIARTVVESHGGAITVTSSEGEGSTFTVTLPITAPSIPERTP